MQLVENGNRPPPKKKSYVAFYTNRGILGKVFSPMQKEENATTLIGCPDENLYIDQETHWTWL
jgi:hypothetical protein